MATEIERKFLVVGKYKHLAESNTRIKQGYLSSKPERSIRIRIVDDKGTITIKGKGNPSGMSRYEWEKEITNNEANELFNICEPGIIDKTRYIIPEKSGLIFEVDEFYGENEGLTIAEIELPSEETPFTVPDWLGKEVTGDVRYYNSMLKNSPFKNW